MELPPSISPHPTPPAPQKTPLILLLSLIICFLFGFFLIYLPGKNLLALALTTKIETEKLKTSIADKDIAQAQTIINNLKGQLSVIDAKFKKLSYLKPLPYFKNYYHDGGQLISIARDSLDTGTIVIEAIKPYQDFLGLKGAATSSAKTTEDRIAFLTQSIEGLLPHLDLIEKKISNIDDSLNSIDINRYPEKFKDFPLHQTFNQGRELTNGIKKLVTDGKPILSKTSWLLGKDKPRNYLVIFQNDGELRPSGGFWTAYTTVKIDNGKVIPGSASNIYDLDDKLQSTTPAPRLIKSYHINVPYLNLRDSNLSPDFPVDAQIFLDAYYKAMGKSTKFDAVVALDTNVLVDLVSVLGKLDTRVGTFTTDPDKRCDGCPKIIYDLEWISGRPRNFIEKNRKDFMGPVMQALLANAMGSEKNKIPLLAEAFINNVFQKHILFFFPDSEMQTAAVLANIAGNIVQTDSNTDYLHLNDANFASAKSNIFIRQKIKHEISVKNNQVEHKISITYTNPSPASNCNLEKGDLCLNAPKYRDLFRFYVPLGSQLIKMTGSEIETLSYEELGKQVFEGFYGDKYPLYAKSSSKVTLQYLSNVKASKNYTLYLQKQPGTKGIEYELYLNGKIAESFEWLTDKTIKLSL
ncbi:MAG: DUF4012 domain-containing protein [Patescibacteria group bacterium]